MGATAQAVEFVLTPLFGGAHGHDLLGKHVKGPRGHHIAVKVPAPRPPEERDALHQLVAGERKKAALGSGAEGVARAADPLQEQADGPGRSYLAHQVHRAYVYPKLQRGRGHAHPRAPILQASLGSKAALPGEAAVVSDHRLLAKAQREEVCDPLRQPACVDEHQGGPVGGDKLCDPVQRARP